MSTCTTELTHCGIDTIQLYVSMCARTFVRFLSARACAHALPCKHCSPASMRLASPYVWPTHVCAALPRYTRTHVTLMTQPCVCVFLCAYASCASVCACSPVTIHMDAHDPYFTMIARMNQHMGGPAPCFVTRKKLIAGSSYVTRFPLRERLKKECEQAGPERCKHIEVSFSCVCVCVSVRMRTASRRGLNAAST